MGLAALALIPELGEWAVVIGATAIVGAAIGLLIAPASTVVMNDLPEEKAGDGSSLSMIGRFAGGAIGVALLGSVFASVFASHIDDVAERVAPDRREIVEQSISGAEQVAATLPPTQRRELLHAARAAFDDGAQVAFAVAALVAAAAAAGVFMALSRNRLGRSP